MGRKKEGMDWGELRKSGVTESRPHKYMVLVQMFENDDQDLVKHLSNSTPLFFFCRSGNLVLLDPLNVNPRLMSPQSDHEILQ